MNMWLHRFLYRGAHGRSSRYKCWMNWRSHGERNEGMNMHVAIAPLIFPRTHTNSHNQTNPTPRMHRVLRALCGLRKA